MVLPGDKCEGRDAISAKLVAARTLDVLRRTVPPALPSINFLSGGMSEDEAAHNLNQLNLFEVRLRPWQLSFSYGRVCQDDCLRAWCQGDESAAQRALLVRCRGFALASQGRFEG